MDFPLKRYFHAAPNIDHSQDFVRKDIKEWLHWLSTEVLHCSTPDPMKQESLLVENAPDPLAGEQINWIQSTW